MMTLEESQNCRPEIADQIIKIGAAESEQIRADIQTQIGSNSFQPDHDADVLANIGASAISKFLDRKQGTKLEDFGMGIGQPFVMIDGLPEPENLPDTPQMFNDDSDVNFSDSLLLGTIGLSRLQPIAFLYENYGRLMRNVAPIAALNVVSSYGSKEPLEFHTDNGYAFETARKFHRKQNDGSPSPHFLFFGGLRNHDAEGNPVPTEILRVSDIVNEAGSKLLTSLQKNDFKVMPGMSNHRESISHVPLLQRCHVTDEWWLRLNSNGNLTVGLNRRAQAAVRELIELIISKSMEDRVISIVVSSRRVLGFDNYRVLHRRRAFEPGDDLTKARWLRRCFACQGLRHGYQIDPIHRPFVWT